MCSSQHGTALFYSFIFFFSSFFPDLDARHTFFFFFCFIILFIIYIFTTDDIKTVDNVFRSYFFVVVGLVVECLLTERRVTRNKDATIIMLFLHHHEPCFDSLSSDVLGDQGCVKWLRDHVILIVVLLK